MKHLIIIVSLIPLFAAAQKKPLDHTVYDSWQSVGERSISNDGKWLAYTITPQEGDAALYIQPVAGNSKTVISRGYNAVISADNRYVVCKIRPWYKDTREARIKKKKPEDFPKDSMAIIELASGKITRFAKIRSFKMPEKGYGWMAYQKERDPSSRPAGSATQKTVDSLRKKLDSLTLLVIRLKNEKAGSGDGIDADDDPVTGSGLNEGSDVVYRSLTDGKERTFKNVSDYQVNMYGQKLLMRVMRSPADSAGLQSVILFDVAKGSIDTLLKGGNDFRNFALTEDGSGVAFVAERDSAKSLQKFCGLYLYRSGDDSAHLVADKKSVGMNLGQTVSENGSVSFSKTGRRLLFGTAPIQPPKDTSLIDIDLVKLDIWNYKDDYLMTQQLFQLNNELKRNYLAVYDVDSNDVRQLGSTGLPTVIQTNNGDGEYFVGITDTGRRIESQWAGQTKKDIYAINVKTGERTLIKKNHDGQTYPSSTGKYVLLYDNKARNYFVWDGKGLKNITSKIKVPLYNEKNDLPDDPNPYGIMGWQENDSFLYVYDKYDAWRVDPNGLKNPQTVTDGRIGKIVYRYLRLDSSERSIRPGQQLFFKALHDPSKKSGFAFTTLNSRGMHWLTPLDEYSYNNLQKSKNADAFIFTKESYVLSPNMYVIPADDHPLASATNGNEKGKAGIQISSTNPQQQNYNWGTAELYKWKSFDDKDATGVLYKPEDFNPSKKYPMLVYFYEELSDGLNNYIAPAPTPSRLNIPFFVSRGYLVFTPDIRYTKGHPGKDAYNYVVSGAQSLSKNKWVDSKNIGIQGQSWGGYQVAYLVTATNMFKAAWAGAPVVNMFSAYGGIRWESGNNRQFQYEKGQSRIGYTPWARPDLYIENSPFFHLKNVTTPLVIMSNDADGAVPWYQGIEFFTAMRRLNKKVWLLNYNGEAHNLVERKNRKDIQIREQEYFDWQLKGDKPA
ncbi:MAG: prolyl oligopeptidase family serine peptidase [Flavisolibacter sp.]